MTGISTSDKITSGAREGMYFLNSGQTTFVYEWFHGQLPAADDTIGVLDPFPGVFYAVAQLVGPNLTAEGFRDAIFAAEPTRRSTASSCSR